MATYTPNPSWLRAMDTAIEQVEKRSTDLEKFSKDYKAELKAAVDAMADITLGDVPQPAFIPVPIEPAPEANLSAPPVFPTSNLQLPSAPERPQFMDVDSALGDLPPWSAQAGYTTRQTQAHPEIAASHQAPNPHP